ncbi:HSP20-like chaperones superfamily protein [Actinidia rufa]|uniref:HSP20-like chaperones superfamily protein n=1 Tax=Actinidia rufa TaxID=165716 RepID=A0A7J0E738_9ERIC|nr:HSP20-like chaperones superfamily protein [Actinidia rufa]
MAEKLAPEQRHSFFHGDQKVFEWDQTLEEVNIYITLPPNTSTKLFYCKIQSKHVELGIKGNPPYLNHDLSSPVKTDCSFWTIEDDIMHITLQKRDKGQTWASPILGQGQLDPYSADVEQKRLMLQRFQEECGARYRAADGETYFTASKRYILQLESGEWSKNCGRYDDSGETLQNPGFDFSQAQFSGNCPDPRTFMGGIRSD